MPLRLKEERDRVFNLKEEIILIKDIVNNTAIQSSYNNSLYIIYLKYTLK